MTTQLAPTPVFKAFDNNGSPLANGLLYSYIAGTTTPQATYTDSTGGTPNTNPVVLNARGEANVWLNPTQGYKLVLTDSLGNQVWSVDGIIGPININQSLIPAADNTYSLGSPAAAWAQLYLGANHTPVLNNGVIGYWPQTAAELAAGVAPVNLSFAWGNLLRYGSNVVPGTTDMSSALVSALKVNQRVYVPAGTYLMAQNATFQVLSGQELYGDGALSILQFSATGAIDNLQMGAGVTGASIHDLALVMTYLGAVNNYQGVVGMSGAINCKVHDCDISGFYAEGVALENAVNCEVRSNYFHGAQGTLQDCADVCLIGLAGDTGCNYNIIRDNQCFGGGYHGVALLVGSASNALHVKNLIQGNVIGQHTVYGIVLHAGGASGDWDCVVSGNFIENILGSGLLGGNLSGGAGIYLVDVGGVVVSNNRIRNCCVDTNVEQLAPAAIGISTIEAALSPIVVSGNVISEMSQYYGILSVSNVAPVQITGNAIDMPATSTGAAIKISGSSNTSLVGNSINQRAAGAAILIEAVTSTYSNTVISQNNVQVTTGDGVFLYSVTGGAFAQIAIGENQFIASGNSNLLSLSAISSGIVRGNYITNGAAAGAALLASGCAGTIFTGNYIYGGATVALEFSGTNTGSIVDKSNIVLSASGARSGQNAIQNAGGVHVESLGSAVPTAGTALLGDTVYNTAGATPFAWQCTAAGSPGTWTGLTLP